MALIDEIKDVVANQLNISDKSKITDTASFVDDLNADSLDLVELIMELEKRYEIKIPQEDQEKIKNYTKILEKTQNIPTSPMSQMLMPLILEMLILLVWNSHILLIGRRQLQQNSQWLRRTICYAFCAY